MSGKRFEYIRGKYKHGIHDTVKDGEYRSGYRTTYDDFDLDKLTDELNIRENRIKQLENENEQLKIHMKSAKAHLEGGHTKKAIERLQIEDR